MQRRVGLSLGMAAMLVLFAASAVYAWRVFNLTAPPDIAGAVVPPDPRAPIAGVAPYRAVTAALQVPAALAQGNFRQERKLTMPPGFQVSLWATGLSGVRLLAVGPESGDIYATQTGPGRVVRLTDPGKTGVPTVTPIIAGLDRPHGIAWHGGRLYIAENGRVLRLNYRDGDAAANGFDVVTEIAAGGGHVTRTIAFGPDGKLYVAAGSSCNVCREADERRAAISRHGADGRLEGVFARGLRNAVGLVFRPGTDELWATVNGRDGLGDNVPAEQFNRVREGDDFGWPVCHGWGITDPSFGNAESCQGKAAPAVAIQAHSAPLGLRFYDGAMFPETYRGDAFIALHGSWNRSQATGAKVIRVHFADGRPAPVYENFLTGFQLPDGSRWGRPVDLIVAPDGALLLSDDYSGSIYRITYGG